MRDKKRIKVILKLIEKQWTHNPDYRFGQLLINLGICNDEYELWHLDDDLIEEHLEKIK